MARADGSAADARGAGEEAAALLGDGDSDGAGVPRSVRALPDGWINVLGIRLPRSLALLLCAPVALLLIHVVAHLFRASPSLWKPTPIPARVLSNGTHAWHALTLVVSLDGFRPSYLTSHTALLPNLLSIAQAPAGVRAEAMQPVFPTLTFPNHWALMTGLYPAWSGIVANDFWVGDDEFRYTDSSKSWNPRWWLGEPMWSAAKRAGRKTAVVMWPGPPVTTAGVAPDYFVPYRDLSLSSKLDLLCSYLDLPLLARPDLINLYVPDVDQAGHAGGPESADVAAALARVDDFVGSILRAIDARNASDIVDVVIVSDHGMASTHNERLIYLDDILGDDGIAAIEHRDGWPSVGLHFRAGTDEAHYLTQLETAATAANGTFSVYTHATMPARYHFTAGGRVAPVYVVPSLGWAITDHHEVLHEGDYRPKGNHGYDNDYAEMQAIFFARGPFAAALRARAAEADSDTDAWASTEPPVLRRFRNLEILNLVMRLQGIEAVAPPNNGTRGFWAKLLGD
ncbi:hypothetical protein Q5752_004692 [Cryptotrichosporon argae]